MLARIKLEATSETGTSTLLSELLITNLKKLYVTREIKVGLFQSVRQSRFLKIPVAYVRFLLNLLQIARNIFQYLFATIIAI